MMLRPKENMLNDIRQNFRKEVREQIPKLWLAFVDPHSCEDGSTPGSDNLERDKSQDQVVGVTRAISALESVNLASSASSIASTSMGRQSRTHKTHDSIRQTMSIKGESKLNNSPTIARAYSPTHCCCSCRCPHALHHLHHT